MRDDEIAINGENRCWGVEWFVIFRYMKVFTWCNILFLIIVVLLICAAPVIFTQGALFGWEFFDLSDKGTIGDTIGGITAPIVGLLSVFLLWLTLKEQLEFNKRQDEINKDQQKFNDANRILSMESHILHLDENLYYAYTCFARAFEGHGVSSLRLLVSRTDNDIAIVQSELEFLIDRVHIIETALCSMVDYINKSSLVAEERKSTIAMAELYLSYIHGFYGDVTAGKIQLIHAVADLHCEELDAQDPDEQIKGKTRLYRDRTQMYLDICHKELKELAV